jgi:ABC-type multidrug transport system ATPase subunit
MRQKVNLMQAFIHEPKIIILDEPLAALDKGCVPKVVKLIKELAKSSLVIVSTHHLNYFRTKKKKVFYFKDGELIDA